MLILNAAGGGLMGQGRHHLRADGVRRGDHRGPPDRLRRLPPRRLERPREAALVEAVRSTIALSRNAAHEQQLRQSLTPAKVAKSSTARNRFFSMIIFWAFPS